MISEVALVVPAPRAVGITCEVIRGNLLFFVSIAWLRTSRDNNRECQKKTREIDRLRVFVQRVTSRNVNE
jgi:hypothetical protein